MRLMSAPAVMHSWTARAYTAASGPVSCCAREPASTSTFGLSRTRIPAAQMRRGWLTWCCRYPAAREAGCGEKVRPAGRLVRAAFQVVPGITACESFRGACMAGDRAGDFGDDIGVVEAEAAGDRDDLVPGIGGGQSGPLLPGPGPGARPNCGTGPPPPGPQPRPR